jgi:hypothetical protein
VGAVIALHICSHGAAWVPSYVWMMQDYEGHTITVTNGLTGGFVSKILLDRAQHRAVIVLSNTAAAVNDAAYSLLVGEHAWISSR